eukprot:3089699-Prymnesium_polylepis.2
MGVDQGSPGGPAYAGTAAQIAKQQTAKRIRDKESYGLLAKHELDKDHLACGTCVPTTGRMALPPGTTCKASARSRWTIYDSGSWNVSGWT